jgi:haloalkane dehalogenase
VDQKLKVLRTPDDRFKNLVDYPFTSHYVFVEHELRMHYIDEGDRKHSIVLLLHGEPSWSFLYRNIIPSLVKQGYRVIAPDLIGFGKSDKPADKSFYTYQNHTAWLTSFIERLGLDAIHLYCHDWGGMIALRIVAENPNLFSSVIVSYAFLFTGEEQIPGTFLEWQNFSQTDSAFLAGSIVAWGTYAELSDDIHKAYDAPFPDETYKIAARQFPLMIPFNKEDPEAKTNTLLRENLKTFDKPFLTIWGDHKDEMWLGKDKILQAEILGAAGQDHQVLHAGHFLQEDKAKDIAEIIINFLGRIK